MSNPARNLRDEHHVIWLEPQGAPDRCWCSDNQWDDEGIEYVLRDVSDAEIARLRAALAGLAEKVDCFNGVCSGTGDKIADRAKGEMSFALDAALSALSEVQS